MANKPDEKLPHRLEDIKEASFGDQVVLIAPNGDRVGGFVRQKIIPGSVRLSHHHPKNKDWNYSTSNFSRGDRVFELDEFSGYEVNGVRYDAEGREVSREGVGS